MNYNEEKLESLAKELEATVNHAVEVIEEYVATAIEQEVMNAIDKLSQGGKEMLLAFAMLDELTQSQPEQQEQQEKQEPEKDDIWALLFKEAMEQMERDQLKEKQIQEEIRKIQKYLFG